jgi:hypothetical protein
MTHPEQPQQFVEAAEIVEEEPEDGSAPLSNPRHEMFSQFRALAGLQIAEAYNQAGGPARGDNAFKQGAKIAYRPDVKLRMAWLKSDQARKLQDANVMSRREVLEELKTNVGLGRIVKGGLAASNKALELIGGEEHEMFIQKRELRTKKLDELDGMDQAQIIAYIGKAAARIPGLEIDAEALATAVGLKPQPAIGDGRTAGDGPPDTGSEVPEGEDL